MSAVDGRSYDRSALEHCRFRAIELHKEGKSVNEISHFFGLHRGSVSRWITAYNRNGKSALKRTKAPGAKCKLSLEEMKAVIRLLKKDAMQHGFDDPLWTCKRIQQLIVQQFGKKLHTTNVMRLLKRWGFTPQKPERQAKERDDKAVKRWLKEDWPEIEKHVKRWQAMLYFQDEAGVALRAVMGKTWAPKGKTPIVKVTAKRGGLTVTSAISPAGLMVFRIEKARVNADLHIEFLQQVMKHHPNRKIIIIEDRAPVHTAKKVDNFIEQNKNKLAIYRIPSYAPDLNPDEHVWEYLKAYKLKAHQAQTKTELKKLVISKMQSIQRSKSLVQSFFQGTHVT